MIPLLIFSLYNLVIVFILYKVNIWQVYLLKDTIVWLLFSGVLILYKSIEGSKEKGYFKSIIINNLSGYRTLLKIGVPIILSIFSIIPVYILALYSTYEQIFMRVGFYKNREKSVEYYIKFKILLHGNININKLNKIWRTKGNSLFNMSDKHEVKNLFNEIN